MATSAVTHAGDVTPAEAYTILESRPDAVLVDVRTRAEWSYVGVPDLAAVGKEPVLLEWQTFPTGAPNAAFVSQLSVELGRVGVSPDAPLLFLCRSGARSLAAARAMAERGYTQCFNIVGGFEGPLDAAHHRGGREGWKACDLPWVQS